MEALRRELKDDGQSAPVSIMEMSNILYNINIPDSDFTKESLVNP